MPQQLVIIGGGVIGLCCAYYATEAGHQVTLIDRNAPARDGCSFGNAGMIVPSHFVPLAAPGMIEYGLKMMWNRRSPFHIRPRLSADLLSWGTKFAQSATEDHVRRSGPILRDLNLASRACYVALSETLGHSFGLTQNGLLMLCRREETLHEETHAAEEAKRLGIAADVLTASEAGKLDPAMTMDIAGAVFFPKDCHLNPSAFVLAMQNRLESAGVRFLWNQEVTDVALSSGRISAVRTRAGMIEGDAFVLAGGAWSPTIASKIRLDLPMQAGKGYSLTLSAPRQLPKICSILTEARVAVTPMGGTLRFGGTMEIVGLDESIDTERVAGIVESSIKYFPAFRESDFAGIKPWHGLRPCSPDGLPYIGRTSRAANLIFATGHAMMGLSLAPITGKLVSQLLGGTRPEIDLSRLSPERFDYA